MSNDFFEYASITSARHIELVRLPTVDVRHPSLFWTNNGKLSHNIPVLFGVTMPKPLILSHS